MPARTCFREEAADPKPMTRPELEAAAAKHGVTVAPAMSDRAVAEAVAERLMPGAYTFAGRETGTYALRACELALAAADKAAAEADAAGAAARAAAASSAPVTVESAAPRMLNGTGAHRGDAAALSPLSAEAARAAMIRRSAR